MKRAKTLDEIIEHRSALLVAYQNAEYAREYRDFISRVRAREQAACPGSTALTEAAAKYLYKLMAYKDEYLPQERLRDGQADGKVQLGRM